MDRFFQPMDILHVEDNPGDVEMTRKILHQGRLKFELHVVRDGEKAIAFLNKTGAYRDALVPDLIFLDLNIPKKNGHEVLAAIKEDPKLKSIPVIIFTSSDLESDVTSCYHNRANCYVKKPCSMTEAPQIIRSLQKFWCKTVKLPHNISRL
jgi:two-component system, chemotaxis family, response regulator Rcp1